MISGPLRRPQGGPVGFAAYNEQKVSTLTATVEVMPSDESDPWVPLSKLLLILQDASADPGLLDDLADVRGLELDHD